MSKVRKTANPISSKPVNTDKPTVVNHTYLGIICSLLALVLYINTLGNEYAVDDVSAITENKLTQKGIRALPVIFTTAYLTGYRNSQEENFHSTSDKYLFIKYYRPLSVAMFAVEWQLASGKPWLSHLVNILLYILTAWLLYNLLSKILSKHHPLIPFFITLLYVALPVHTEVVANIKSRDEILGFMFAVIAISQTLNWVSTKKLLFLLYSAVAFFLALLSKESMITFAAAIPLLVYFFTPADKKLLIKLLIVFLICSALFIAIRYSILGVFKGKTAIELINNSLVETTDRLVQLSTAIYIMGKYVLLLLFPVTLNWDYAYKTIPLVQPLSIQAISASVFYALLIWYSVKNFKKRDPIAFGILFFLLTISIVSNIVLLIEVTLGERLLYTPSLGYCIAFVLALLMILKKPIKNSGPLLKQVRTTPLFLFLTFLIITYSVRTIARNKDWKNNFTLLEKDVKSHPTSVRSRSLYGGLLISQKALIEKDEEKKKQYLLAAIDELKASVGIIEGYADPWYNLGVAYKELGDAGNAISAFEKSRSLSPFNDVGKLDASALAYGMAKQYDKAIADLQAALVMDPKSTIVLNDLGMMYVNTGNLNAARNIFFKLISVAPNFAKGYYDLGVTYDNAGDKKTAIDYYNRALRFDSAYFDALVNAGICYANINKLDSARFCFEKIIAGDPTNPKGPLNMGVVALMMGDSAKAQIWFYKARLLGAKI